MLQRHVEQHQSFSTRYQSCVVFFKCNLDPVFFQVIIIKRSGKPRWPLFQIWINTDNIINMLHCEFESIL